MNQLGSNFSQRNQHERSLGQTRMRDSEFLATNNLIVIEKDVYIDRPRDVRKTGHSAQFSLDFLGQTQKLFRTQFGRDTTRSIEKKGLLLVADRLSLINRGNSFYGHLL